MSLKSVLERLGSSGSLEDWWYKPVDPTPRRPHRDSVAVFVAYGRDMKQLSTQALASMANVSVSSIERIERGEPVSDQVLENVAVALGQEEGAFTAVRRPLGLEAMVRQLEEHAAAFEGMVEVPVSHFTKHSQVRELSRCHAVIVEGSRLLDEAQPAVEVLREMLDFASFERVSLEGDLFPKPPSSFKFRELNEQILGAVCEVERIGYATALTGCYDAEMTFAGYAGDVAVPQPMAIRAGLVAFFPKMTDPCAVKRRVLYGPKEVQFRPEDW